MDNQSPEPQRTQRSYLQYFIGIGIGLVPLIIALISIGGNRIYSNLFGGIGLGIALLFYVGLLVASIVCLCIKRSRFIGYGLLTMVFAIPIISFISCVVIIRDNYPR